MTENSDSNSDIPEGFFPFPLDNSFNDVFAPMYIALDEEKGPRFALKVEPHHLNPMGICHGAVYMTLFDISFPGVIGHALGKYAGTPTMNISVNFIELSKEGEWLFTHGECLKVSRTAAFAQGTLKNADGVVKASASGVFKLPKNMESAPDFNTPDQYDLSANPNGEDPD